MLPSGDQRGLSSQTPLVIVIHSDSGISPLLRNGATKIRDRPAVVALKRHPPIVRRDARVPQPPCRMRHQFRRLFGSNI